MGKTILQWYDRFIVMQEKLIDKTITKGTHKTYKVRRKNLSEFLYSTNQGCLMPGEIKVQLIRDYEFWLRAEKGYSNNYVMKNIQMLDMVLNICLEFEEILANPVRLFKYRYESRRQYDNLNTWEINLLSREFRLNRLQKCADLFVFQCYTGLSYSCLASFDYDTHVHKGPENTDYIIMIRAKTNEQTIVPLLPIAKSILVKYSFELPILTVQAYNKGIKDVSKICRIDKHLTTHTARKTFANIMHDEYGVDLSTISAMLGHASEKTTKMYYVKKSINKIHHDMKNVIVRMMA